MRIATTERSIAPGYQIEIGGHYYSVPSKLIREIFDAQISGATVETFHKGERIACNVFSAVKKASQNDN